MGLLYLCGHEHGEAHWTALKSIVCSILFSAFFLCLPLFLVLCFSLPFHVIGDCVSNNQWHWTITFKLHNDPKTSVRALLRKSRSNIEEERRWGSTNSTITTSVSQICKVMKKLDSSLLSKSQFNDGGNWDPLIDKHLELLNYCSPVIFPTTRRILYWVWWTPCWSIYENSSPLDKVCLACHSFVLKDGLRCFYCRSRQWNQPTYKIVESNGD